MHALRTGVAAVNVTAVVEEFRSISENKIFNASVIEIIEEYIMSELYIDTQTVCVWHGFESSYKV